MATWCAPSTSTACWELKCRGEGKSGRPPVHRQLNGFGRSVIVTVVWDMITDAVEVARGQHHHRLLLLGAEEGWKEGSPGQRYDTQRVTVVW